MGSVSSTVYSILHTHTLTTEDGTLVCWVSVAAAIVDDVVKVCRVTDVY